MINEEIKEAIDILNQRRQCKECVLDCNDGYKCDDCKKAFDLTISALSQPQRDLISRAEVLSKKTYMETEEGWSGYTVNAEYIEQLPSAQPDIEQIR